MIAIVLQEKGGEARRLVFDKSEVIVGRVQGNDIVLPKGNVSKRHARIQLGNGKIVVSDHKSTNGTYVNGRKITSPLVVRSADKIYIGDYILTVEEVPDEPKESLGWEQADNPSQVTPPVDEVGDEIDLGMNASGLLEIEPVSQDAPAPMRALPSAPRPVEPAPPRFESAPPPPGASGLPPPPGFASGARSPSVSSPAAVAAPFPRADSLAQPGPMPGVEPGRAALPRVEPRGAIPGFPGGSPAPAAAPYDPFVPPTSGPVASAPAPRLSVPTPAVPLASIGNEGLALGAPPVLAPRPRRSTAQRELMPRGFFVPPISHEAQAVLAVQQQIVEQICVALGIDGLSPAQLAEEALWQRAERAVGEAVGAASRAGSFGAANVDTDQLGRDALNEVMGWGLLEEYLSDETVDAVTFDRYDSLAIRRADKWLAPGRAFSSEDALRRILERIATAFGIPWQLGMIDVPLRSGVRLTAVMPPASPHVAGAVRKTRQGVRRLDELTAHGALSATAAQFLRVAISERRTIGVVGPVASARISVVGALLAETTSGERLVSIEDAGDLSITRANHIALERRGQESAAILGAALALRPDRLVVVDPGLETMAVLAAMTTAVDGGVLAWTAVNAVEGLDRLTALAAVGRSVDAASVRQLVAAAVAVVITCSVDAAGDVKISDVSEVGLAGHQWRLAPAHD
ncbi:MAG: Flp pilus assembly complex ATPase component TadA [Myxococcales bacterium]|nr:Flp pilus assembly complex ATPase component TadA [Myxococcales bacterium]